MERDEILALVQKDPESLVTIIQNLEKLVIESQNRIAELERQLNMNSGNSSQPPSKDGYKRPQKQRKKSGKPPGGQKGHKGHTIEWKGTPDKVETHRASVCMGCGASLEDIPAESVQKRQVHDIPLLQIFVTEHHAETVVCPHCGQIHEGSFPAEVPNHLQYGANIKALMVYLCIYQLIPYERAAEIFSDLFVCSPVKATLMKSVLDCATNLDGFQEQVKNLLSQATVLHVDETGLRVNGKREWLHTTGTGLLTLYAHHKKRGKEAMNEIGVIPAYNGILVHDCWAPYFGYSCEHAVCNAHILRDLKGISENFGQKWSDDMESLLIEIYTAVENSPDSVNSLTPVQIHEFLRRYDQILDEGLVENQRSPALQQGKRGRKKRTRAENLIIRCRTYREEILRFMVDFRVPFTNNLAERDIRMVKVQQKVSGSFRSSEGASNFCKVRGYISTVKKNGISVLAAIKGACVGEPFMPTKTHRDS